MSENYPAETVQSNLLSIEDPGIDSNQISDKNKQNDHNNVAPEITVSSENNNFSSTADTVNPSLNDLNNPPSPIATSDVDMSSLPESPNSEDKSDVQELTEDTSSDTVTDTTIDNSSINTKRPDSVTICDKELEEIQTISKELKSNQAASSSSSRNDPASSVYHLKWFYWKGEQTPIVTQNENGPCPLLAIANVLILARKIIIPSMQQLISAKQLMEYIGDTILQEAPKQEENKELVLNYQQNMHDAIDIMYKLQTGIDVNVKFSGVTDFEFTPECIVFDLLKIVLYHGWLVDPQEDALLKLVQNLSYNQLVEKMLLSKEAEGEKIVEGLIIEDFLSRTASQLTYHGLCELHASIQEEELCVFFRNNHFSTLYKHKGELFLLVTDQGFLTEAAVSWETLVNIEGDGQFVNSDFKSVTLQSSSFSTEPKSINNTTTADVKPVTNTDSNLTQEDRDYLIALSLQEDENGSPSRDASSNMSTAHNTIDSDHALALKLQQDEDRLAREEDQRHERPVAQPPSSNNTAVPPTRPATVTRPTPRERQYDDDGKEKCVIL